MWLRRKERGKKKTPLNTERNQEIKYEQTAENMKTPVWLDTSGRTKLSGKPNCSIRKHFLNRWMKQWKRINCTSLGIIWNGQCQRTIISSLVSSVMNKVASCHQSWSQFPMLMSPRRSQSELGWLPAPNNLLPAAGISLTLGVLWLRPGHDVSSLNVSLIHVSLRSTLIS